MEKEGVSGGEKGMKQRGDRRQEKGENVKGGERRKGGRRGCFSSILLVPD